MQGTFPCTCLGAAREAQASTPCRVCERRLWPGAHLVWSLEDLLLAVSPLGAWLSGKLSAFCSTHRRSCRARGEGKPGWGLGDPAQAAAEIPWDVTAQPAWAAGCGVLWRSVSRVLLARSVAPWVALRLLLCKALVLQGPSKIFLVHRPILTGCGGCRTTSRASTEAPGEEQPGHEAQLFPWGVSQWCLYANFSCRSRGWFLRNTILVSVLSIHNCNTLNSSFLAECLKSFSLL